MVGIVEAAVHVSQERNSPGISATWPVEALD